jgi:hydroxymethylpyrimidine/phosphomethylpyrimidine kinase
MTPVCALTIAGSDSGGGAGLQAALKTFAAIGVHGTCAVTALTAQNTFAVQGVHFPPSSFLADQLTSVLSDFRVLASKTGMLGTAENIAEVSIRARAGDLGYLIVDPVMVATRGERLLREDAERAYLTELFPFATVITPNVNEAGLLVGRRLSSTADLVEAARELHAYGSRYVVVKGGGLSEVDAVDVIFDGMTVTYLRAPRIATANNHGTGCTFSAATASYLALGHSVPEALQRAKVFVTQALAASVEWRLGAGHGPVDHIRFNERKHDLASEAG